MIRSGNRFAEGVNFLKIIFGKINFFTTGITLNGLEYSRNDHDSETGQYVIETG